VAAPGAESWATKADLARVEARIDGHENVCAERMKRIDDRLSAGDRTREAMRHEMREGFSDIKDSLRLVWGRIWWAAGGVISALVAVIAFLANKAGLFGG